ncbi:Molybdenum transport ATP-binding protein ModC [Minicystis rosea]|nr:Molybdenum transport ATP-binding protein ModC [Minicystis rosea]
MSETEAQAPLLAASEARIAVDGVTAIDRLTLETKGDHVVLAGDVTALFAAITGVPLADPRAGEAEEGELPGEAYVVAGTLALAGRSVADRAHVPAMGAAPLDPPLPPGWTAEEYVAWGARLGGAAQSTARELAQTALKRVGLAQAHRKRLDTLVRAERRVLALAQALVLAPEVLVAEAPLSGLEGSAASFVTHALLAASEGRRVLLSAARLDAASAEGALARGASHLVVLAGGEVAVEGAPAELFAASRVVTLTVRGNADALRAELQARGIDLRGGPLRFSASLPSGATTRDLLAAAVAARAAVMEMVPVLG